MRLHQTLIHQSVDLQVIDQCQTKQTDLINVLNSFSATVGSTLGHIFKKEKKHLFSIYNTYFYVCLTFK